MCPWCLQACLLGSGRSKALDDWSAKFWWDMSDFAQLRRMMVDCQLRTYDVTDRAVLAAMDSIERHRFVAEGQGELAYLDRPASLNASGRVLMTPMVVGRMIQTLDIQPGEHVVDYAGGTGYSAALMAHMGAEVSMVEIDSDLSARARTVLGATGYGHISVFSELRAVKNKADAILVNGSSATPPDALFKLLAPEGRLIIVQGAGRAGRVMLYRNAGEKAACRPIFDASAPVLAEFVAKPAFAL
jgi:protein-L-isoaspartate(D-aspartate) O-methyltransferase